MKKLIFALTFIFSLSACAGAKKSAFDKLTSKKDSFQFHITCQIYKKGEYIASETAKRTFKKTNSPQQIYKKGSLEAQITIPASLYVGDQPKKLVSNSNYSLLLIENGKTLVRVSADLGGSLHFSHTEKKISIFCDSI